MTFTPFIIIAIIIYNLYCDFKIRFFNSVRSKYYIC